VGNSKTATALSACGTRRSRREDPEHLFQFLSPHIHHNVCVACFAPISCILTVACYRRRPNRNLLCAVSSGRRDKWTFCPANDVAAVARKIAR
jgi:hypothetical protein